MFATFCCIWFCVCVLSWVPLVLFANASLVFIYIVSAKFVCLPTRLNVQFRLLPPNEFISKPLCKVLFLFAIFLVLVFFCFFFYCCVIFGASYAYLHISKCEKIACSLGSSYPMPDLQFRYNILFGKVTNRQSGS